MVYIGIALAVFLAIGVYLLRGIKDYTDKVPHISPRENTVVAKETVLVSGTGEVAEYVEEEIRLTVE